MPRSHAALIDASALDGVTLRPMDRSDDGTGQWRLWRVYLPGDNLIHRSAPSANFP